MSGKASSPQVQWTVGSGTVAEAGPDRARKPRRHAPDNGAHSPEALVSLRRCCPKNANSSSKKCEWQYSCLNHVRGLLSVCRSGRPGHGLQRVPKDPGRPQKRLAQRGDNRGSA